MWGAKIYQNRHAILRASSNIFYEIEHKIEYGFDQKMLDTFIWPLTINNSVRNYFNVTCHFFFFLIKPFHL